MTKRQASRSLDDLAPAAPGGESEIENAGHGWGSTQEEAGSVELKFEAVGYNVHDGLKGGEGALVKKRQKTGRSHYNHQI
jgi:hypothetical protein